MYPSRNSSRSMEKPSGELFVTSKGCQCVVSPVRMGPCKFSVSLNLRKKLVFSLSFFDSCQQFSHNVCQVALAFV